MNDFEFRRGVERHEAALLARHTSFDGECRICGRPCEEDFCAKCEDAL